MPSIDNSSATMEQQDKARHIETAGPPGTVRLTKISEESTTAEIILHPKPTNDPNDPLNWRSWEKMLNFGLTLVYALLVFTIMSVITPAWPAMNEELNFSYELLNNSYAAGTAALCFGGLILMPFAMRYGRRPVYFFSLAIQFAIAVWSAKMQTAAELFLVNIISCSVGALSEVLVQTTVADMYFVHQRGNKNNIYIFMTITGNSLGPVASGYVTTSLGWRWIYWTVAIITGALTVAFFFLYEETMYTPYITGSISEERREDALEATLTRDAASGAHDKDAVGLEAHRVFTSQTVPSPHLRKSYLRRLALLSGSDLNPPFRHIASQFWQPLAMMVTIPAVAYVCLMYGVVIAGLQIMTTTTSTYMSVAPYNFSGSQIGLMSVAPFIGTLLGAVVNAPLCDRMVLRLSRRNNGIYEPEMRLWQLLIFSPALPAGLLIYGYGLGNGDPWIVLAVGTGLFAFGLSPVTSISLTYLTDSFEEVVSNAIIAVTFAGNACATVMVLAITPLVNSVGISHAFLIYTVVTVVTLLLTVLFLICGKQFRVRYASRYYAYARAYKSVSGTTENVRLANHL